MQALGLGAEDQDCAALLVDPRALTRSEMKAELGWTASRLERVVDRIRWRLRGDGDVDLAKRVLLCAIGLRGTPGSAAAQEPQALCLRGFRAARARIERMALSPTDRRLLVRVVHPDQGKRAAVGRALERSPETVRKLSKRISARCATFRKRQVVLHALRNVLEAGAPA
ncbi:MAG: hypothetical protein ACT4PV_09650 [Planctomycetaceae bacterium]